MAKSNLLFLTACCIARGGNGMFQFLSAQLIRLCNKLANFSVPFTAPFCLIIRAICRNSSLAKKKKKCGHEAERSLDNPVKFRSIKYSWFPRVCKTIHLHVESMYTSSVKDKAFDAFNNIIYIRKAYGSFTWEAKEGQCLIGKETGQWTRELAHYYSISC